MTESQPILAAVVYLSIYVLVAHWLSHKLSRRDLMANLRVDAQKVLKEQAKAFILRSQPNSTNEVVHFFEEK